MSRPLHDWLSLASQTKLSLTTGWRYGFLIRYWYVAAPALALFLAWTWCCVVLGPNGWRAYQQKKAERQRLQTAIEQLKRDNERLERRVKGLQSDRHVQEEEAINGGYVRRRATVYRKLKTNQKMTGSQNPPRSTKNPTPSESSSPNERPRATRGWLAANGPIVVLTFLAVAAGLVAVVHFWLRRAGGL